MRSLRGLRAKSATRPHNSRMQPPPLFRFRRPAERAALREWWVLALLLTLASGLLGYAGGLDRANQALYAAAVSLMPHAPADAPAALGPGGAIADAGSLGNAAFSALPVLALMAALLLLSPRRGLLCSGALLLATLGASLLLLRFTGLWFAPAAALIGLILAYPLWRWRRLEATLQTLGDEILRGDAGPHLLPDAPESAGAALAGADLVEPRILGLEAAGERLRDARRQVSDALESRPDAAVVVGRDGVVLHVNGAAARLLAPPARSAGNDVAAVAAAGLRGARVADLIAALLPKTGDPRPLTWEQLQALATPPAASGAAGAEQPSAGVELAGPEGSSLLARCAPCGGADGAPAGWIVSLTDITPLRQAERSRDEVLTFLSHDLRSPQSSILALLELHELDPADNPKEDVHLRIAQYARRTLELSEQFLQLARAETRAYAFDTVDLGVIAEEAVEETWAAAEQKRITLQLRFDGEPVPVRADPALLRRALINLLGNAVKYSPEGTVTTIRVDSRDGWSECEIVDQGNGMSADNLNHLFERFRRFSRPGQPKAQGAGLGMAFVKTVVEKHGGSIQVESAPGQGSRFLLRLPPAAT